MGLFAAQQKTLSRTFIPYCSYEAITLTFCCFRSYLGTQLVRATPKC